MKYFIVVIALLLSSLGWSQSLQFVFRGVIENIDLGKNEGGVTISIVQNGSSLGSAQSASNGKYTLKGNVNYKLPFDVVFTKSGLVTKKVAFDLSKLNEEDTPASTEFEPVEELNMTLFKVRENVDFSFLDSEPVAKFTYDEKNLAAKVDMATVNRMRTKIDDLLNSAELDKAKLEADYQAAIQEGNSAFAKKEYESALASFEEALGYKPNEKYPADKIIELDALIKAQKNEEMAEKQANQEYFNLIEAGDKQRDAGELEKAVATFKLATAKKTDEQYPKDQIVAIQAQIDAKKKELESQTAYDAAIKSGDALFKQNSLRAAKDKYTEATTLKPSEAYPKQKLLEIESKMKDLEAQEATKKKYQDAIAAADKAFDAEDFAAAKEKYTESLTFETASTYAKGRMTLCNEALANSKAEAEKAAKIKELLLKGTTDLSATKYQEAVQSFTEVLTLDASNAEATTKLAEAKKKLDEKADAEAQELQYAQLIKDGDAANTAKKLEDALAKYQEAKTIKSTPEVTAKITAVQEAINAQKSLAEKETKYTEKMADAAKKVTDDDLNGAITSYTAAAAIDPSKPEPAKKIAEIQKILDDRAAADAKNAEYNALMKEGGELIAANDLDKAKAKFQAAALIDPKSPDPKAKIKEVDDLIAKNKADKAQQDKLQAAITAGDNFFNEAKWEEAQAKYREVTTIDPANSYAKDRISLIDLEIAKREKTKKIDKLLADANVLRDAKKLELARTKYQEVLALDPSNSAATSQIDAINSELAALQNEEQKEKAFADLKAEGMQLAVAKKYPEAKQKLVEALSFKKDAEVETKIKDIDALIALEAENKSKGDQYNAFIEQAKSLEEGDDLIGAIAAYQKAGAVKPDETLPKTKIKSLQDLLAKDAAQQETIDKEYTAAMARGEVLMKGEKYLDAIKEFNTALALKPTQVEPKTRAEQAEELERQKGEGEEQYQKILTTVEAKIASGDYVKAEELIERAKGFRPEDKRPQELLDQVNKLKAKDKEFAGFMAAGEVEAAKKNYPGAIAQFEKAKGVKPSEAVPNERIEAMNKLINDLSSTTQKEELYKEYMNKGKSATTGKKFVEALGHYQNALSVKAADQEATDRIAEIQQILDDLANADKQDQETKSKYNALIKEADALFTKKDVELAKVKYDDALLVDPYSAYAKARSEECTNLLINIAGVEKEEQYRKLIDVADKNFTDKKYDKAKEYYLRAISMRSADPYPKKKLEEIEEIENPAIVQSFKLEDLGERVNGTIDGGFVIEVAEADRRLLKGQQIENERDKAIYDQSMLNKENQAERYETQNELYDIQEDLTLSTLNANDARIENVEKLRVSEFERKEMESQNAAFEKGENLSSQQTLDVVTEEVALDYMNAAEDRQDNMERVKEYQTAHSDRIYEQSVTYKENAYASDVELNKVAIKVEEDVRDDYAERLVVEQKVDGASDQTIGVAKDLSDQKYDDVQLQRAAIVQVQANASEKATTDDGVARDNNEKVGDAKEQMNEVALAYMMSNQEDSEEISTSMDQLRRKLSEENVDATKVRDEANERLKIVQSEYVEQERIALEGETDKYRENKAVIDGQEESRIEVADQAKEAMDDKIAYVEGQQATAREKSDEGQLSDEEERLLLRNRLENVEIEQSDKSSEHVKAREENSERLKDAKLTESTLLADDAAAQREKNLAAQQSLDGVSTEQKEKVKVANSLGQEYPEGVSEESFTRKDEAGLVTTVITRRIVVISGHADVYVRTQTKNGITYSKNGNPSLQHVWNNETQGPELVRHF